MLYKAGIKKQAKFLKNRVKYSLEKVFPYLTKGGTNAC